MRSVVAILATVLAAFQPVLAGETAWQEIAPDVSLRLISGGTVSPDGKVLMALEIDMPEATKTYWRVPGETGLPADLDLSSSSGVADYRVLWPYPLREIKSNLLDYVYYGHTVLPLELDVTDPNGIVDLKLTLGICSEICIPAQASLSLPLTDAKPDGPNLLRIRQALAEVPISWTDDAEPVGAVEATPDGKAIGIEIDGRVVDATSVIASSLAGVPLFGAPQKSPQSDLVVLPILGKSDNSDLEGLDVEVTFMTDMGAYVVHRTIEPGTTHAADTGQ